MEWLEQLKEGDEVAVVASLGFIKDHMARVDRLTKTQIIVGTMRFKKDGRYITSDGWTRIRLVEPTPEVRARIRKAELVSSFGSMKWENFSLETLERVFEAVKQTTERF